MLIRTGYPSLHHTYDLSQSHSQAPLSDPGNEVVIVVNFYELKNSSRNSLPRWEPISGGAVIV